MSITTTPVTVATRYTAEEVPPRCRKPRPVTHELSVDTAIPTGTGEDFPMAFRVHGHADREQVTVIRWDPQCNRLFSLATSPHRSEDGTWTDLPVEPGTEEFRTATTPHPGAFTEEEAREAVNTLCTENARVIDGQLWRTSLEPGYYVTTFGLGGNHGGTALFADYPTTRGLSASEAFRANEFEAAREHAVTVATQRGDTQSVPRLRDTAPGIEVLAPEAVTLFTETAETKEVRKLRSDYEAAVADLYQVMRYGSYGRESEPAKFEAVLAARAALVELGVEPVDPVRPAREQRFDAS